MHARGKSGDEFSDDSQKVDGPPFDGQLPWIGESGLGGRNYRQNLPYMSDHGLSQ